MVAEHTPQPALQAQLSPEPQEFIAGLDLGQQGDYTALAIVERVRIPVVPLDERPPSFVETLRQHGHGSSASVQRALAAAGHGSPHVAPPQRVKRPEERIVYHLRHLERPPLGTPYPTIVSLVCARLATPPLAGQTGALVIDATGVGRPVVDLLREDRRLRAPLTPVTITGGDTVTRDGQEYHVPKRDLVGALQVLLQTGAFKIAQGLPLGETLVAELMNFQAKISLRGHDSYEAGPAGAWREGAHDDLVLAVALACWYAQRPQPSFRFFGG